MNCDEIFFYRFQNWRAENALNESEDIADVQIGPFSSIKAMMMDFTDGDCAVEAQMIQSAYKDDVKVTKNFLRFW